MESPDVEFEFASEIWYWRGPSPFHFVTIADSHARDLQAISAAVTYGWGVVPATVRIGQTEWKTSLFPKDGGYALPIKDKVRKAERLQVGDTVTVRLEVP
jgi:hypothetical protein